MAAAGEMIALTMMVTMAMVLTNPFPHETGSSHDEKEELNFQEMIRELFPDPGSRGPPRVSNMRSRRTGNSRNLDCHGVCQCYSRFHREYFCCQCLDNTCFPGDATVDTENGHKISLSQLRLGQKILAASESGEPVFSPVIAFLDRRTTVKATYVSLGTNADSTISLSGNHLLFRVGPNNQTEARFADEISVGDMVYVSGKTKLDPVKTTPVTKITREIREGAYVPLTETGTIFVDGVLASCYASFDHRWSHWALRPVRWAPWLFESEESQLHEGVRPYIRVLKWLARTVLPTSLRYPPKDVPALDFTPTSCSLSKELYNAFYWAALSV